MLVNVIENLVCFSLDPKLVRSFGCHQGKPGLWKLWLVPRQGMRPRAGVMLLLGHPQQLHHLYLAQEATSATQPKARIAPHSFYSCSTAAGLGLGPFW